MTEGKNKILVFFLAIIILFGSISLCDCSIFGPSENDIEIVSQGIEYDGYALFYYKVKVKNISSKSLKLNFYAKIYVNNEIVDEGFSNISELSPGETVTLEGPGIANPKYAISSYSGKITRWNFY